MEHPAVRAAIVSAAAAFIVAFWVTGIYSVVASGNGGSFVLNRFTGATWFCSGYGCYSAELRRDTLPAAR